jgi:polyphenol oxidase
MVQSFALLHGLDGLQHGFIPKISGIDVLADRDEVIERLKPEHLREVCSLGFDRIRFAEQVHGAEVAVVTSESPELTPGVDGLVTSERGLALGIYVADCAAVYLADKLSRCIGLVHSGRKGSESGIAGQAIELMRVQFGVQPEEILVQVGPCIRPPHYEVDFAAMIRQTCLTAGILPQNYSDCGVCTSENSDLYYSYRLEKGRTGRMLAVLGLI